MRDEERGSGEGKPPVFPTAQLVWMDEETGEVLEIELVGADPWAAELTEQGFALRTPMDDSEPQPASSPAQRGGFGRFQCRIEIRSDRI
ncbi:MAG: hypothetical protein JNL28_04215 [Planctomycetes bacterium]|nr:hypothetical protein [Planctomycetota bacterium]